MKCFLVSKSKSITIEIGDDEAKEFIDKNGKRFILVFLDVFRCVYIYEEELKDGGNSKRIFLKQSGSINGARGGFISRLIRRLYRKKS